MSITDPWDTLAHHLSRPLVTGRDMSWVPSQSTAKAVVQFRSQDKAASTAPEAEALCFYAMNHGMAVIRQQHELYEPLGQDLEFVEAYHRMLASRAVRAFYYLLLICTRESRHVALAGNMPQKLAPEFGQAAVDFNLSIRGSSSLHTIQAWLSTPPDMPLGRYVDFLRAIFYQGKFSKGYGGPAWGAIADCLARFVHGEYSAELMLDTIWTLNHNNGTIFNKQMFYANSGHRLTRILDVQRSGQIPAMVCSDAAVAGYVDVELSHWMAWLRDHYPDAVAAYVDWFVVETLGAVAYYPTDKAQQLQQHGPSAQAAKTLDLVAKAAQQQKLDEIAAAELHTKQFFHVMPGLDVAKIQRAKAA